MSEVEDRLADAVNQEPIVYNDCTQSELMSAFIVGVVIGLSIGIAVGVSFGVVMLGVVLGLILTILIAWAAMTWLKWIRQKYYLTWFKERVFLMKLYVGLLNAKFIKDSQRYGKGARRG